MTLWIQPLFGDPIELPFSPPMIHWRAVYHYLHLHHFPEHRIHQLRLYHDELPDLSGVKEGDVLRLLVSDLMVERWVSEYSWVSKEDGAIYYQSTLTWLDACWGDPYEDPLIQYRMPLTLHLIVREKEQDKTFQVERESSVPSYGVPSKWFPSLREACLAFREKLDQLGEEKCAESTIEHVIHLWELYHATNQHRWDQGRYYDY